MPDVPDRMQFELFERLWSVRPGLERDHDVQPIHLVLATKGGHQTVRPFARAHSRDVLVYWALVDALQPRLAEVLDHETRLTASRWTAIDEDVTPASEPNWSTFEERVEALADAMPETYVLRTDISSFYVGIELELLVRKLLEVGADPMVVQDLENLLRGWHSQGLRGLPQGLPPSVPLANLFLLTLDERLDELGVQFVRHSDDFAVFCRSFAHARFVLDALERRLYAVGLTLGGEKTRIWRAASLTDRLRPAAERRRREMAAFAEAYEWDETEVSEAEHEMALETFDHAFALLDDDRYERSEFIWALRRLGRLSDAHAVARVPELLRRMPGLTAEAMAYLSKMHEDDRPAATQAMEVSLRRPFHRDQEWLHILSRSNALARILCPRDC